MRLRVPAWRELVAVVGGAVVTAAAGLSLWLSAPGQFWVRLSYDLPFLFGDAELTNDVVLVKMDQHSSEQLGQPVGKAWDRSLHARLLNKLADDGSGTVIFDVLFLQPDVDHPEWDESLERALRKHGRVVLAGEVRRGGAPGALVRQLFPPLERFETAVNGAWGVAELYRDTDDAVREHEMGTPQRRSLPYVAAHRVGVGPDVVPDAGTLPRWIRYYGRPTPARGLIPSLSYDDALVQAPGYFRDRVVVVGADLMTGAAGDEKDEFRTPYTRWDGHHVPGMEIQATVFLNLVRGDWLERPGPVWEACLVVVVGLVFGVAMGRLRLSSALGLAGSGGMVFTVGGLALPWVSDLWFPWCVVVLGELPIAMAWSVVAAVLVPLRGQRPDRAAVSRHDSPTLVESVPVIADHEVVRAIGGGAYGEVWLVRNRVKLWRAAKVVRMERLRQQSSYEREFRGIETYMPISLSHPSLLQVLQVGRNDAAGYFYYVMELADDRRRGTKIHPETYEPRELARELELRGRFPVTECVEIGCQLAEGLACLHREGFVHRDVKPANVIFVRGRPKLADVGLVSLPRGPGEQQSIVGTLGYIPPEGPGSCAADTFGLGKVLYEMFTGMDRVRFPELPDELLAGPLAEEVLKFNQLVLHACETDATQRFTSGLEMAAALQQLKLELEHPPRRPRASRRVPKPYRGAG